MNITNAVIKNFKGISQVDIENLGNINVFFGKNNSGKSSILHALALCCSSARNQDNTSKHFNEFLKVKDLFPKGPEKFHTDLRFQLIDSHISEFRFKIASISNNTAIFNPYTIVNNVKADNTYLEIKNKIKSIYIEPNLIIDKNSSEIQSSRNAYQNFTDSHNPNISGIELFEYLKRLSSHNESGFKDQNYENVTTSIKHYFKDLTLLESEPTLDNKPATQYIEQGNEHKLNIIYAGSGQRCFLDILIKLELSQSNIVLLDEPERGLHPDQQRGLIDFLIKHSNERKVQFFISTHSPVFLNYPEQINYYRVYKENNNRRVEKIHKESISTCLYDIGLKPSDLFNSDITLFVEGATDLVFYDYIINSLYKDEITPCRVNVLPLGGNSSITAIANKKIDINNIVNTSNKVFILLDGDLEENKLSSREDHEKIKEMIPEHVYITKKTNLEAYFPQEFYSCDENRMQESEKPNPHKIKQLCEKHLTKDNLDEEIKNVILEKLLNYRNELVGKPSTSN